MPGLTLNTGAFVIEKRPPSDAFQALGLFSPEHGGLLAMQRIPRRPSGAHVSPDLFDSVAASLESSNQGRTWFVRELRVTARRAGIGRGYEPLRFASAFAAVIGRNPVGEESRAAAGRLLGAALDAFAESPRPDIVYLKSLYLFARDEGYPVKQDWLPSLGAAGAERAGRILALRPSEQDTPADEIERMRRSLEAYLAARTEIRIP